MWRIPVFLILLWMSASAGAQESPCSQSIDEFVDRVLPASGAPGIAYAIIDDGTVCTGTRGEALSGSGHLVTADTPFQLGSISKSFTALAVLQLVDADRVELDSPIADYLDVFDGQAAGHVTIRQLLSHTSGYSTFQGNLFQTRRNDGPDALADNVRELAHLEPARVADRQWQYSNANYLILGRLVEAVSGRAFADYIQAEILDPAGMNNSFVADGGSYEHVARGHRPWFGTKRAMEGWRFARGGAPAGGIVASANDVARYLAILMNGEDDLISAESKALMFQPASPASPFYGFGWSLDVDGGTAFHTGVSPGVETIAALSPSENRGVVVLVNSGSGIGFGENTELLSGIATLGLGQTYEGGRSRLQQKAFFVTLVILPFVFLGSMVAAWKLRRGLRAKSGLAGRISLWFPLAATLAMAWCFVGLVPRLFGVSLATLHLYAPDLAILLVAGAVTGVAWSIFRLGVFYSAKRQTR
tara:strand:+ start:1130 stop:2551 length:1422 start_codon:yes stop_codon:yes gene_type:complete